MVKYARFLIPLLGLFFLAISFYPTLFEVSLKNKLYDRRREFILEHNYYWPDFNLYLSKIRQGWEGRWTALERYTSEPHNGSFIQIFYVWLGQIGRLAGTDPNGSYQIGRILLSPLLMGVILLYSFSFFKSTLWRLIAFLTIITAGSFPRFFTRTDGTIGVGRFMEWWSNIDPVQRLTFLPHILFGQVISFFILHQLTTKDQRPKTKKLILLIFFGNIAGLVFPPSLMTLSAVLLLLAIVLTVKDIKKYHGLSFSRRVLTYIAFILGSSLSLFYILVTTRSLPWSSLVEFHRTHPMMIPLDQYVLGTGPIFFLGILGAVVSILRRDRKFQPLILWVIVTFAFAAFFSAVAEQSPLRFTQTGVFIPLGILTAYFFYQVYSLSNLSRTMAICLISLYLLGSLFMMKKSIDWQTEFITQRAGADIPPVPVPPQTMYPLRQWMDGIRWLRDNTGRSDVILAAITAGNFIPAYSGNTVYFGQSNTVDYERKQAEVTAFFEGKMSETQGQEFLKRSGIRYVFFSVQEQELAKGRRLESFYPFLKRAYTNPTVTLFTP